MRVSHLVSSFTFALLAACGQQAGDDTVPSKGNTQSAESAEAAPVAGGAEGLVYPASKGGAGGFTTSDPIDQVVAYYWADGPIQQRGGQTWTVSKPEKRDGGYLVSITTIEEGKGQSQVIYLNPAAGGGTEGRVRVLTAEELKSGVKL